HNQYLQVYAELGGAGLLLWIGVLGFGVAGALAAARSLDRKRRALGAGTGGGLLVLATHALFETPLEFPFTATLTFALAAAAVSLGFGGEAEDPRTARAATL